MNTEQKQIIDNANIIIQSCKEVNSLAEKLIADEQWDIADIKLKQMVELLNTVIHSSQSIKEYFKSIDIPNEMNTRRKQTIDNANIIIQSCKEVQEGIYAITCKLMERKNEK